MFYLLGGGGGVLERRREYCWMTDASILSMFRPMVRPPAGLDPAYAPSPHQIPRRLEAQFLP
ncbi:hypothetical protein ACOSQ2_013513 [Xanthoceras sorbifolium]